MVCKERLLPAPILPAVRQISFQTVAAKNIGLFLFSAINWKAFFLGETGLWCFSYCSSCLLLRLDYRCGWLSGGAPFCHPTTSQRMDTLPWAWHTENTAGSAIQGKCKFKLQWDNILQLLWWYNKNQTKQTIENAEERLRKLEPAYIPKI